VWAVIAVPPLPTRARNRTVSNGDCSRAQMAELADRGTQTDSSCRWSSGPFGGPREGGGLSLPRDRLFMVSRAAASAAGRPTVSQARRELAHDVRVT